MLATHLLNAAAALQDEAPEPELDDDEDLVMLGNVEKNDKCPYTRKDVSGAWVWCWCC